MYILYTEYGSEIPRSWECCILTVLHELHGNEYGCENGHGHLAIGLVGGTKSDGDFVWLMDVNTCNCHYCKIFFMVLYCTTVQGCCIIDSAREVDWPIESKNIRRC